MKKALFLDRDGVINYNFGYVYKKNNFKFIDGIFNLIKTAISKEYLIIVVTNQAGIGRGYYTENDFLSLMEWVKVKFKDKEIHIDDIYFCPYHPEHGLGKYKKDSELRKPNPGMLLKAKKDHGIDLSLSIMIGDSISDIEAGKSSGIKKNILFTKNEIHKNIICISNLEDAKNYL